MGRLRECVVFSLHGCEPNSGRKDEYKTAGRRERVVAGMNVEWRLEWEGGRVEGVCVEREREEEKVGRMEMEFDGLYFFFVVVVDSPQPNLVCGGMGGKEMEWCGVVGWWGVREWV